MPRRKTKETVTVDELLNELETASETIKEEANTVTSDCYEDKPQVEQDDKKRDTLLKLAEDGDITKSVAYIKKSSHKTIDKLYLEYERRRYAESQRVFNRLPDLEI